VPALLRFATFEDSEKRTLTTTLRTAWQKHREQLDVGSTHKDVEGGTRTACALLAATMIAVEQHPIFEVRTGQ
jgi:hypothetical protein